MNDGLASSNQANKVFKKKNDKIFTVLVRADCSIQYGPTGLSFTSTSAAFL